jgi:replicative DNA helicase Mcm
MEEGWFTITKYGISAKIYSPTTIIASANPLSNSNWNDDEKIDIDEIPALKPIKDRFDLIFIFRSQKDEKEIRRYAYKKGEIEAVKVPDYTKFIIKYLEYAKRINPKINDEARAMLNEFFIKIRGRGFGSYRVLDILYRLSEAVARLKLKEIVDIEDAKEVMEFYNVMLQNFEMAVNVSVNPKQVTYDKFVETLQNSKDMERHVGVTIQELHRIACKDDEQINSYLGPNSTTDKNRRLKDIATMLRNSRHIIQIGLKPLIFKFRDDLYDAYDVYDTDKNTFENENDNRNNLI